MFPASMLQKLFVKGSLKNTPSGFEMKMKNIIDTGTLIGVGPLVVDGTSYEPSKMRITTSSGETTGDQLSRAHPLTIHAYSEARLQVTGDPLPPGEHQIKLQLLVNEAGQLQFAFTESLSE